MKNTELRSLIREEVKKALAEAIDIHNDESAMKALEDIAVNMTKWKGSEGGLTWQEWVDAKINK